MTETIAFDFNPFCNRAVLLDHNGGLLSYVDSKDGLEVAVWLGRSLDRHPDARIVGSPLDDCPSAVEAELHMQERNPEWLRPTLCRSLYHAGRTWNLARKLHRARMLAHLDRYRVSSTNLQQALREFEHERARQILEI